MLVEQIELKALRFLIDTGAQSVELKDENGNKVTAVRAEDHHFTTYGATPTVDWWFLMFGTFALSTPENKEWDSDVYWVDSTLTETEIVLLGSIGHIEDNKWKYLCAIDTTSNDEPTFEQCLRHLWDAYASTFERIQALIIG